MEIRPLEISDLRQVTDLLKEACPTTRAHLVSREKVFEKGTASSAMPLGAWTGDELKGLAVLSGKWLRLLAVAPQSRKQGIATALLTSIETRARENGVQKLRTLDQPGNYLSPGVSDLDPESQRWLSARSFTKVSNNQNLTILLAGNSKVSEFVDAANRQELQGKGIQIESVEKETMTLLVKFVETHFSKGWAEESKNAVERDAGHVFIATRDGQLLGFTAHDGNNTGLGWFGPAGTLEEMRGLGIGRALTIATLTHIRRQGHEHAVIPWIGPKEFYRTTAGIYDESNFTVFEKELTP